MITENYGKLVERGFIPTRHGITDNGLPTYLLGTKKDSKVIMKHLIENIYFAHVYIDRCGDHFTDVDIEGSEKFDNIKTLEQLIAA